MAEYYGSFQEMLSIRRGGFATMELEEASKNYKGIKVKLIDALDKDEVMNLPMKNDRGSTVYRPVKFVPGKVYALPKNDVAFREALMMRGKIKKAYSEQFKNALEKAGVPHKVIKCPTCGGKVNKIEVQRIEVIGDE